MFVWVGPAWVEANDKVKTEDDVKKFLADAWEAYRKGLPAAPFGKGWKP